MKSSINLLENNLISNQNLELYIPANSESYVTVTEIYRENAPFTAARESKLTHPPILLSSEDTITSAIATIQLRTSNEVALTFPEGSTYVGGWKNNMPEGKGKLTFFQDGIESEGYEGEWVNGEKHGYGIYFTNVPDGQIKYEGNWKNGLAHGKGKQWWPNGNIYTGDFFENQITGKGVATELDGTVTTGDFFQGYIHGSGTVICGNGNRYEGSIFQNKKHGKGVFTFPNGITMRGEYIHGVMPSGKITHTNYEYEGQLDAENRYHGKGKLIDEEGVWEGVFYHGMKQDVIHTDHQGKLYTMSYSNNALLSSKEFSKMQYRLHQKKIELLKKQQSESSTHLETTQPKNKNKKVLSIDELAEFIEGPKTNTAQNKKKAPARELPQTSLHQDPKQKSKEKIVRNDKQKTIPKEKDKELSKGQVTTLRLLKEGVKHLPKFDSRTLRWGKKDVFTKMDTFEDSGKFLYQGMTSVEKNKMILFHEGGSMLDPIIFHPSMMKEYVYDTNRGKGCYAEITTSTGSTCKGVIEFGIDGEHCYHRMFELRGNFDFLTLSANQFFNSKSNEQSNLPDYFYEDISENQLMYDNYIYEYDEQTGVFSVYDSRENINATITIFPVKHVRKKLARTDIRQNNFMSASS